MRQAAKDVLTSHESEALDAREFLTTTGVWLLVNLVGIPLDAALEETARLVRQRWGNRGNEKTP